MDAMDVIRSRRMLRRFDATRHVPDDLLRRVLEVATYAPSAGHTQGRHLVVLTRASDREAYWSITRRPGPADAWFTGVSAAPVIVLCCSDPDAYLDRYAESDKGWTDRDPDRWGAPYWDIDTGMSALLVLLAAEHYGVGGLFFGVPAEHHSEVRDHFGIPARLRLVGALALGYPAAGHHPPSRRRPRHRLDQLAHWGRFGTAPPPAPAAACSQPSATR